MDNHEILTTAAMAAGMAAGDVSPTTVSEQQARLLQLANREEADRWCYDTDRNSAHVWSGVINTELDTLSDHPSGIVETYSVSTDGVPLGFEVMTEDEQAVGTLVHLSAEQAEGLAVDLLEQAHAMREESTSNQAHSGGSDE